jgi:HAD superfamily hydrolase (TIGR01549 family)
MLPCDRLLPTLGQHCVMGDEKRTDAPFDTAVLDIDGTLVDSNYQHALAWFLAFRRFGITLAVWQLHRAIGMGGDRLVAEVAGEAVEEEKGDALRAEWRRQFDPMLDSVQPCEGARDLLAALKKAGKNVVLASSGAPDHVDHYLDLLQARDLADAWTTSEDVATTKPAPDLIEVALRKVHGGDAVMIGDSTWDAIAASKLGISTLAVRTGGFSPEELTEAGAVRVYVALPELRDDLVSAAGRNRSS